MIPTRANNDGKAMVISSERFYGTAAAAAAPPRVKRFKPASAEDGWHTFALQEAALRFMGEAPADAGLMLWSLETDAHGARRYIVASLADFWRRYRTLKPEFRHYYEVIVAGTPCHLYLDLEFHRGSNPEADGDRMVTTLRSELDAALRDRFGAAVLGDVQWIEMDSSTEAKFSRHVVLRLQGAAFENNLQCGALVHDVWAQLDARRASEPKIAALWVHPPPPKRIASTAPATATAYPTAPVAKSSAETSIATATAAGSCAEETASGDASGHDAMAGHLCTDSRVCFVDLSVYSRNRCFRIFKSSKVGKRVQLLPAHMDQATLWQMSYAEEERYFEHSLATNVENAPRLLVCSATLTSALVLAPLEAQVAGTTAIARRPHANAATSGLRYDACPFPALEQFALQAWSLKTGVASRVSGAACRRPSIALGTLPRVALTRVNVTRAIVPH